MFKKYLVEEDGSDEDVDDGEHAEGAEDRDEGAPQVQVLAPGGVQGSETEASEHDRGAQESLHNLHTQH